MGITRAILMFSIVCLLLILWTFAPKMARHFYLTAMNEGVNNQFLSLEKYSKEFYSSQWSMVIASNIDHSKTNS